MRRLGIVAAGLLLGAGCGGGGASPDAGLDGGLAPDADPSDASAPDGDRIVTTIAWACEQTAPAWADYEERCGLDGGLGSPESCCETSGHAGTLCGCISEGDYRDTEPCVMALETAPCGSPPEVCTRLLERRWCGVDAGTTDGG